MRFPKRLQGLILGFTALVAGPIVAVALTSGPAAQPSASVAALLPSGPVSQALEKEVHLNQGELRDRVPIPPPTPTPTPVPTPKPTRKPASVTIPSYNGGNVEAIIRAAAAKWGVSGDWMVSIARCESGLRPNAYNPRGPYYGLFQFLMSTFTANGGTNIWDPTDQSNIAAKMLAHGQAHQWSCA